MGTLNDAAAAARWRTMSDDGVHFCRMQDTAWKTSPIQNFLIKELDPRNLNFSKKYIQGTQTRIETK